MDIQALLHDFIGFITYLFHNGGAVVWLLLGVLVWCLCIIVVKSAQLRHGRVINRRVVAHIEQLLIDNRLAEATAFCKKKSYPMTRVILAGILHYDRSEHEIKERLEEAGRQEIPWLRAQLTALRSIASAAPLMGLFGTVLGMIQVFSVLSKGGVIRGSDLAGGISEALITTACGLVVAIPAIVFYNTFTTRVTNLIIEMERISLNLVAVLKRNTAR
ncbi:MAG: MotA/TolQ/ExbB proton channel family protein [Rhodospirillaceae bacterium]